MDKLKKMFEQQESFMRLLQEKRNFPNFPLDLSKKEDQRFIKEIAHECMHELFEAIHLLKNSKSHRNTQISEFNREAFLEEISDTFHYLVEIIISSGISVDEIYEAYMKKGKVNEDRINSGY